MRKSKKVMEYHGRRGKPMIHETKKKREYVMVRHPSGKGTKRLYLVNGKIPKKHKK